MSDDGAGPAFEEEDPVVEGVYVCSTCVLLPPCSNLLPGSGVDWECNVNNIVVVQLYAHMCERILLLVSLSTQQLCCTCWMQSPRTCWL